jgi:hypothetical protein
MDEIDRTDELIAAMLDRRSRQPAPESLLDQALAAVTATPQVRRRGRRSIATQPAIGPRFAIVGAVVLVVAGLTLGAVLVGGSRSAGRPAQSGAAVAGAAKPSPSAATADPASATPAGPPSPATPTPPTKPVALMADTLAVVTQQGHDLRVRSAPGLGEDSARLWPLLASGTRLLVIGGPVHADGYDWYEVMVENQPDAMYGWVAAGRDGERWIRSVDPDCRGAPGRRDVADMPPFDFLVCYHDREVTFKARINEAQGAEVKCPWLGETPCDVTEGWLLGRTYVTFTASDGKRRTIGVAVPSTLQSVLSEVPGDATLTLTIAMDAPEARSCRVTDPATGKDLVPPNRVVTVCRLAFEVRAAEVAP